MTRESSSSAGATWVFTVAEIRSMLERAGLAVEALYGGLERTAFRLGHARLLLVARRP